MKKLACVLGVVAASVGFASAAWAKGDASGTAAVPDGSTMAAASTAGAAAANAVCAKTKGAKRAHIIVSAGAVAATFNYQCAQIAAATTTPTTTAPAGPIFTQSGSGTATTDSFKVPSRWDLQWSYDCSGFAGGSGNFIVTIYDDYGQNSQVDFDNQGINQLGAGGNGVEHYHSGGNTKFFKVVSECNWTLTVTKP
jgi:hypothetical protein